MREPIETTEPGELIRLGTIATVDLAARRCTVAAGDVVSGPIRWMAARAGSTRAWSPPSVGEQVVLLCPDGELAGAIALPGIETDANPLPGQDLAELVEYEDGAKIGYDPQSHALTAILPAGASAHVVAATIKLEGDVEVDGNFHCTKTVTADVDVVADGISSKSHIHIKVQPGSGVSGGPQ